MIVKDRLSQLGGKFDILVVKQWEKEESEGRNGGKGLKVFKEESLLLIVTDKTGEC